MDVRLLISRLREAYPDAACALEHQTPFQLLVATILSAQCTDARVNMVTPGLFARFPDAAAMSQASQGELEEIIRSIGFYRNKAKAIRAASERIMETFGGTVPRSMEELLTLAGVARKTANVVLGVGYGLSEGVVVDTHIQRISRRLGLGRSRQLSLIWEAFNLTNRPNYTAVDNTLYSLGGASLVRNPLFGRKTGQADGRVMQLAAKLLF